MSRVSESFVWGIRWETIERPLGMPLYGGSPNFFPLQTKTIYSNVLSETGPMDTWTKVTLTAPGNNIAWLWCVGQLVMDNLKIVRDKCNPTGDPALDDPAVRQGLKQELALAPPNQNGAAYERRGYIYRNISDGSYFLQYAETAPTQCGYDFGPAGSPLPVVPVIPGTQFTGDYHTHSSRDGAELTDCVPALPPGQHRYVSRDAKYGGGSEPDWTWATRRGASMYVVAEDGHVYRLDPGFYEPKRGNNPYNWHYQGANDCLVF